MSPALRRCQRLLIPIVPILLACAMWASAASAQSQPFPVATAALPSPFDRQVFDKSFSHHRVAVNGIIMNYVTGGQGEPLYLLHGFPQSWYMWRHVMPALAQQYTVVAPDLRGFGESGKPPSGYDKATLAQDVYALMQALGHRKVRVVGQDWGGVVAYALTVQHPEAVSHLVNIEGTLPGAMTLDGESFFLGRGAWWFPFHNAPDGLAEMLVAGKERAYLSHMLRSLMYDPSRMTDADIDEYMRTVGGPNGLHAQFEVYRTMPADIRFTTDQIRRGPVSTPVLAIGGGFSTVGGQGVVDSLQKVASDVQGIVLAPCGHYLAEECPAELLDTLVPFLSEGSDRPR